MDAPILNKHKQALRLKTVGVGVIGTGFGRLAHIPAFQNVKSAKVIGVASRSYARAQEVAKEFHLPKCFSDWKALIDSPKVDAVSIATPPGTHEEITLRALAAGKAVLCEKPLALNGLQAKTMLETAQRAGQIHMVNFEFREIPAWRFLKRQVESEKLGKIHHINIDWILQSWSDPMRPWSWRSDETQGYGILSEFGAHVFDYIEWLFGPVRSLTAQLSTRIPSRPDNSGRWRSVSSPDCCHLLMELESGTPLNLTLSIVAPLGKGHWIEIYGEHKVLILGSRNLDDYGKGFTFWEAARGSHKLRRRVLPKEFRLTKEFSDGRIAPFLRLAQRFVDAVKDHKMGIRPSFQDGLRAQVLMDSALEAKKKGGWVVVPKTGEIL